MSPEDVIEIIRGALDMAILLSAMPLMAALVIGLSIGMVQAATQINEMTLSFIPKLLVLAVCFSVGGPWMLSELIDYTQRLFREIPYLIG